MCLESELQKLRILTKAGWGAMRVDQTQTKTKQKKQL